MFNPVFTDPNDELLQDRLSRVQEKLRGLDLPTREEYQAEVYSAVNAVLALGNQMQPLAPVAGEGPAIVGDVQVNMSRLNQDAEDVAKELLRIEDLASRLFNLAATTQNALRQQIREQLFGSNSKRYVEAFLHSRNLGTGTATVDYNAGVATAPLLDETEIDGIFSIGENSVGTVEVSVEALTDDRVETALVWNGTSLELIVTFATPAIINRMKIELDDYQGLEVTELTTSPDGTLTEDILADLGEKSLLVSGIVGKYSGDFIVDFPARHAKTLRMVIEDRVDVARIALRSLSFFRRRYGNTGTAITLPITAPTGTVRFTTSELTSKPFTSISHQISYNGVQFSTIMPGDKIVLLSSPFWYRAVMERSTSKFESAQGPLVTDGLDPEQTDYYTVRGTSTTPLGNGIIERTILLDNVTGPVVFQDIPLPGTLIVQEGAVILGSSDYAFSSQTLSFPIPATGVTVTYQTTALGAAALKEREEFYTPYLYEVMFEKV